MIDEEYMKRVFGDGCVGCEFRNRTTKDCELKFCAEDVRKNCDHCKNCIPYGTSDELYCELKEEFVDEIYSCRDWEFKPEYRKKV